MPYHVDESTRLSRSTSLSRILFLLTYLLSQLLVFLVLTFLFILYLLLYLLTLLLLVFLSFLIFKILTILSSQLLVSYFFKILRYLPSRSLLLSQPVVLSSKLNESTRKPPLGLPHTESRAFILNAHQVDLGRSETTTFTSSPLRGYEHPGVFRQSLPQQTIGVRLGSFLPSKGCTWMSCDLSLPCRPSRLLTVDSVTENEPLT